MRKVGLKILKNKLSEYIRPAAAGETVVVTDRGHAVAKIFAAGAALRSRQRRRSPLFDAMAQHNACGSLRWPLPPKSPRLLQERPRPALDGRSMSPSARSSRLGETVRPSAVAVLMINGDFVGC